MNRRTFLKSAVCLAACPSTLLAHKPQGLFWSTTRNEWIMPNCTNTVGKGPYSVVFGSLKDLYDCHNLCATAEMAAVVVTQLQYSKEDMKRIWDIPWENTKEKERARKDLRRIEITKEEVMEIYNVMEALRGPHDCVWRYCPASCIPSPDYWLKVGNYA